MQYQIISKATSANIGPGFDCLGVCLSMSNIMHFEEYDGAIVLNNHADTFRNKNNLVVQSFLRASERIGYEPKGLRLSIKTVVPLSRGLGSSATCITAGVLAAFLLSDSGFSRSDIFDISAEIEGHADNVAPNIFGGATMAYKVDEYRHRALGFTVDAKFRFVALVPEFKLSTQKAREVLPLAYPLEDVVFNMNRMMLVKEGLEHGDSELLRLGLHDRLHQDYRKPLIKNFDDVTSLCADCGAVGTYLSGAGPTIMAIIDDEAVFKDICSALRESPFSATWTPELLEVDYRGLEWQEVI